MGTFPLLSARCCGTSPTAQWSLSGDGAVLPREGEEAEGGAEGSSTVALISQWEPGDTVATSSQPVLPARGLRLSLKRLLSTLLG